MKKLFLSTLLVGLFLIPTVSVSAQEKETAHWSFGVKGGVDYFRVAPRASEYIDNAGWAAGAFLEYSVNPLWSFGLAGDYMTYNRNKDILPGSTIDATLYTSVNMSNLLAPQRTGKFWKAVNVYTSFGLGAAAYACEIIPEGLEIERGDEFSGLATAAVGVDINLGKRFALGLEGQYRYYTKENLGGHFYGKENDAIYASLGLRYKFNGAKKDHVRNLQPSSNTDEALAALRSDLEQLKNQANKTNDDVKKLNDNVNDAKRKQDKTNQELKNDIDNLQKALKDLEDQQNACAVMQNIEFKFDSADLAPESFTVLDKVVAALKSNSTWNKLTIAGHTDNVGTKAVNQKVSEKRAQTVKKYLADNGISESKIETIGYGAEKPVASNNTSAGRQQNRRVEFQLSK